ncbi:hypothetical protein P389DRAFT_42925 [Cystobasidium minutum MCA 4210]|uniref:uncharacterized protein n=1 Tax=Cystobasidium minutum MCA 4210 TaxID=1397322 RepID=UPI0034CE1D0A|eukprot:jgi/Rhomi1/42925/CE42924_4627
MSTTSDSGRVLRPRPSRNNLSSANGSANGSSASSTSTLPSSSSRVTAQDEAATSPQASASSAAAEAVESITATVKTTAADAKARIQARSAVIDRVHYPAPSVQAYQRLAIAWLCLTVLIGTLTSIITSGSAITAFRGRLPAASNRITLSSSHLPGPLSGISLDYILPSYFANKRNAFNVIFVKKAWGWTTLLWGIHWIAGIISARQVTKGSLSRNEMRKYIYRPIKRWALATIWWLLFTTWAFGPGLSDRILIYSGARCVDSSLSSSDTLQSNAQSSNPNLAVLDYHHCISPSWKAVERNQASAGDEVGALPTDGIPLPTTTPQSTDAPHKHHYKSAEHGHQRKSAYWVGGHDLSGHAFLLSMSTLFLLSEIAPTMAQTYLSSSSTPSVSKRIEQGSKNRRYAALAIVLLISLWYWMLLMTSLYFHTPQEKFTGLLAGIVGWWVSFSLAA